MAASLAPTTSSTPAAPSSSSNHEIESNPSMTPSTGVSTVASPAKSGSVEASKDRNTAEVVPVEKSAKRERRRDRKSKPKPKPKKKQTAQCVGYYIDALDKKMLWGEAKIIQCNLTTQKIKVHFVGWSKNYDLWTDPMSITAHGRYAPRTKTDEGVKSWDGDMHLFEEMLGTIEDAEFTPVPVPAESPPHARSSPTPAKKKTSEKKKVSSEKKASEKKKSSSKKKTPSTKPATIRPEKTAQKRERVTAKPKAAGHTTTEDKTILGKSVVVPKSAERNGLKPDQLGRLKRPAVVAKGKENGIEQPESTRSSKRQKRETALPATITAELTAKAPTSKKKRALSPDKLPLFRDLELEDGTVLDFSAHREEARAEHEAMENFLDECALIWKKQLNAVSVQ